MKSPSADRLDPEVLQRFLEHCCTIDIPAQTMIIKVNDLSDRIYFLVDGSVEVIIDDDTGHEMVLAYLNSGHFFGEMGFFDEAEARRSAWVRTRSNCVVAEMTYSRFQELSSSDPELVVEVATQMAIRLFSTNTKLSDLVFLDVTGRVAHALLELCEEPDARAVDDGCLVRVTQVQLSRLAGCSREMVIRVLKTLQSEGLIYYRDGAIVVRDRSDIAAEVI